MAFCFKFLTLIIYRNFKITVNKIVENHLGYKKILCMLVDTQDFYALRQVGMTNLRRCDANVLAALPIPAKIIIVPILRA